jgi:ferric-dicitrate binding protein FerR (iron transport regulator)
MFSKHMISRLTAYHHGELPSGEKSRIEAHLKGCSKCRAAADEIQFGVRLASSLAVSAAPDSIWNELHQVPRSFNRTRWLSRTVLAGACVAVLLVAAILIRNRSLSGPSWEVTGLPGTSQLRPGEVLQTDSVSEAQVKIANIGQLKVEPNTRIRLLVSKPDEHRIALDRGRLEASTWSPPRLFIVETPSAAAVDLGCKYSLEVEDDGSSLLHVTLGMVALERDQRETIIPAGAFCRTRPGAGPGTPFFEDSSTELQTALQKLDLLKDGPERTQQLEIVLRESHVRDVLSLWHLIPRADAQSRGLVYDRMAQLLPPPADVTRDGIIALNPKMLDSLKKTVSQLWQ